MFRKATIVALLFLCTKSTFAQLSLYTDVQNELMVWDNGVIRKIDYLRPVEFKIGKVAIPYIDNSNNFKIYYGGAVRKVNVGFTNQYTSSDCIVAYLNATSLNVFDRGVTKNLSRLCTQFYAGDSLIIYNDGRQQQFNAYYNGQIIPIEPFLADADSALNRVDVKSNIAAYINYANQFHAFYHGQVVNLESYPVNSFKAGRNTIAYVDGGNQFKVFQDGTTQIVESFAPKSYSVGCNMVAYVAIDGTFNIYFKGKVYKLGYFQPNYQVSDFVCIYQGPNGYSKVFQDGEVTTLEPYMPDKYFAQYNSVAYFDRNNVLKMYYKGQVYEVTSALPEGQANWSLSYDVIMYQLGTNFFKFYYDGKEY